MRKLLLSKIASLGYDASKFGMNSFCGGDATAATNAGIKYRPFQKAWEVTLRNSKGWLRVRDSVDSRLSVSKSGKL